MQRINADFSHFIRENPSNLRHQRSIIKARERLHQMYIL
jgi:hypothetical protein